MTQPGEHIEPNPKAVAEFVHSVALSMKQLLRDTKQDWGPKEWVEYHNMMRARLALTPEDTQLIQFCHHIQSGWNSARQREMEVGRFGK